MTLPQQLAFVSARQSLLNKLQSIRQQREKVIFALGLAMLQTAPVGLCSLVFTSSNFQMQICMPEVKLACIPHEAWNAGVVKVPYDMDQRLKTLGSTVSALSAPLHGQYEIDAASLITDMIDLDALKERYFFQQ